MRHCQLTGSLRGLCELFLSFMNNIKIFSSKLGSTVNSDIVPHVLSYGPQPLAVGDGLEKSENHDHGITAYHLINQNRQNLLSLGARCACHAHKAIYI